MRSFMLGCQHVIVAAGRRDMGLAFPGWELPGVLGITGGAAAAGTFRHAGCATRGGAWHLGRGVGRRRGRCATAGIDIAALVETAHAPIGDAALLREFADIPLLCGHIRAPGEGGGDGVQAIVVAIGLAASQGGKEQRIECDAILLGVGTVPVIELLDALGCRMGYVAERGGHVPVLDAAQRTSVPAIYAAGDCAGIWPGQDAGPRDCPRGRTARCRSRCRVTRHCRRLT